MNQGLIYIVAIILMVAVPGPDSVASQSQSRAVSPDLSLNQLSQKIELLEKMLMNSRPSTPPAIQRESAETEGINRLFSRAEEYTASARQLLEAGDRQSADRDIDAALIAYTRASNHVAAARKTSGILKQRYQDLLKGIKALPGGTDVAALTSVDHLVVDAEKLAVVDNYRGANELLSRALRIKSALTSGMYEPNSEVVYSLDFTTPRDEYDYERKRYESNQMLVALMMAENAPGESSTEISSMIQHAAALNRSAVSNASKGAISQAIVELEEASRSLNRALAYLGVTF